MMKAIGGRLRLSVALVGFLIGGPVGGLEPPKHLIESLCDEDFKQREAAQASLADWALAHRDAGAEALFQLHSHHLDPEVRERSLRALRLLSDEDYSHSGKGFVGIRMLAREALLGAGDGGHKTGVVVVEIVPNSPAAVAGLLVGDLIIMIDDEPWQEDDVMTEFQTRIQKRHPGTEVALTLIRNDQRMRLKLLLGRLPYAIDHPLMGRNETTDLRALEERSRERHFQNWLDEKPWRQR